MKPKTKIVENQAAAAALLNVDVAEIKAAKSAGCPAFKHGGRIDVAVLRSWFAEHQAASRKHSPPPVAQDPLPRGLKAATQRLGEVEATLAQAYNNAVAQGESEAVISQRRRNWLASFEELRKSAAIEQTDDLVSRSVVESSLSVFVGYLRGELESELRQRCPRLTGLASPVDAARVLDELPSKTLHEILGRCASYAASTRSGFAPWIGEAIRKGARL